MINGIINILTIIVSQSVAWSEQIFNSTGVIGLYVGGFIMLLAVRFFVMPMVRSVGSDSVKLIRRGEEEYRS